MRTKYAMPLLLVGSLTSCALFPTRPTECSEERSCPSGQGCSAESATCVSLAESGAAADLALPPVDQLIGPPVGMVRIPGGQFTMGTTTGSSLAMPPHLQTVAAFYLDETEVTVAAYSDCIDRGPCTVPATHSFCHQPHKAGNNFPANCISFFQADVYCKWKQKRLPTEIEFEYVSRGNTNNTYPWGNDPPSDQLCWNRETVGPCQVGQFAKTLFGQVDPVNGVYDITGNVMEWTSNLLCEYPLVEGGSKSCNSNFTATRGAPWDLPGTAPQEVVSTFRSWAPSGYQGPEYGFRCALTY